MVWPQELSLGLAVWQCDLFPLHDLQILSPVIRQNSLGKLVTKAPMTLFVLLASKTEN